MQLRHSALALPLALVLGGCSAILGLEPGVAESADGGGGDKPPSETAYHLAVMSDAPTAYYPLDEPMGSMQVESVVPGAGAEFNGAVSHVDLGVPGVLKASPEGAVRITPKPGAIHFTSQAAPTGNGQFTFELWIRLESMAPESRRVLSRDGGGEGYRISVAGQDVVFDRVTSQGIETIVAPMALTIGEYTHIAVTRDATEIRLYRNGVMARELPSSWDIKSPAGELLIGSDDGSKPAAAAIVDELALYPTALSAQRLLAHVEAASPNAQ